MDYYTMLSGAKQMRKRLQTREKPHWITLSPRWSDLLVMFHARSMRNPGRLSAGEYPQKRKKAPGDHLRMRQNTGLRRPLEADRIQLISA